VVIPGDVALQTAVETGEPATIDLRPRRPAVTPDPGDLQALAQLLNQSERVTLLCGAGCEGAHEELLALAETVKAPIVHTMRGKEHVERDNPYDVGMTGLIGFASGYYAMNDCDALLLLGADFPYRQFYPQGTARIAQVDVRPENLGRRAPIELGVTGDVRTTLSALRPLLTEKTDRRRLDLALGHYVKSRAALDELAGAAPGGKLVHPQQIVRALSDLATDDAVFTCDVGLPTVWAARYLKIDRRRRLIGSFWHGSMANALAQAIGAQCADPGRQVVSLSGDGGFAMLMGDFLSLVQLGLPVKVVVLNNGSLGFVELEQKSTGFLDFGTDLKNPNFAAMAEAAGVRGLRIESPAEVEPRLKEALAHPGPVLVDAVVNRQELAIPPRITAEMAKGFSLYMLKAVLNGKTDEVLELARTNLWR
jgi:pyruvate dehydrogenase (quinone)